MSAASATLASPSRISVVVRKAQKQRAGSLKTSSSATEGAKITDYPWPQHGFTEEVIEEVLEAFPDKGIASNQEAMILFAVGGFDVLDVRSQAEIEFVGNFPTVRKDKIVGPRFKCIPLINAVRKYDSEVGAKVYVQTVNEEFKQQIEKAFPDKEAKIIVSCSDGRKRAIEALEKLDEMGYANIVGLRGGYNMWNRYWDQNMRRRNLPGAFKEEFGHGAAGMGVHGTGASFENQDAFQHADWKDDIEWIDFQ